MRFATGSRRRRPRQSNACLLPKSSFPPTPRARVERAAGILPAGSAGETRAAGASDTHLDYVVRKALRDQIKADGVLTRLRRENRSEQDARAIADVAVAVPSAEAGEFLLRHVQKYSEKQETLVNYLRHAARYAPEKDLDLLASF